MDRNDPSGEERFEALWAGSEVALWSLDLETQGLQVNHAWLTIAGLEAAEGDGSTVLRRSPDFWFDCVHDHDVDELQRAIRAHVDGRSTALSFSFRFVRPDGATRHVRCHGKRSASGRWLAGSLLDVTDVKASEERMIHELFHDELTGLPNRALFLDAVGRALYASRKRGRGIGVFYLDLDRFHTVNDSLGVSAGDDLLVEVARRIEARLAKDQMLARLGGDKFALLAEGVESSKQALRMAESIEGVLDQPLELEGYQVLAQASLGIALSRKEHRKPEDLLRDAIAAMHHAKSDGAVRHELFDPGMNARARQRLTLEAEVRRAIEREEFVLHYQPIISFETGELSTFEALVRWQSPDRGLVGPDVFIPIAEETGLVVPLGKWVLLEACRQMKSWRDSVPGGSKVAVAVNLSARQFEDPGIVDEVRHCLEITGLEPNGLELEMTESVVMARTRQNARKLKELRELGVRILIDDFGTGYSSLSSLTHFPLDILKIDRSFVSRMEFEDDKAEIVRVLCHLARRLGLKVVAEGIETTEQLSMLRDLDCHYGQGFLFSSAVDGEAAEAWIERRPRW